MSGVEKVVGVLAFLLLFIAAFLAMAETSLSRIDRFRAQVLAEEKRRGSAALLYLVQSPERFAGYLNSVLLLLLATQITASTAIAYLALQWFSRPVFVVVVIVEVLVGYVLAEAMPKTWAVQHTERSALWCAPVVGVLTRFMPMRAITRLLIWSANGLLPGEGLKQGPFVYEQQILALADTAAKENVIHDAEHRLIRSVIDFAGAIAREVMVPRTDMITLPVTTSVAEAVDCAIEHGFSRIPVHRSDDSDEVVGTLFTKDLLRSLHNHGENDAVEPMVRPVKFVPETKRVPELMSEMQQEKVHMAMVVDEYGTVVGLVTLEDLIEELVGEITDEYDVEGQPAVEEVGRDDWRIDARMSIDEVYERINVRLPEGDWDTVGGLLINAFGRVPNRGESTTVDRYKVWVDQTSGRRVTRIRIKDVGDGRQPTDAAAS